MPFPSAALSAGNLTSLRSDWWGAQYLSLCPNTVIFAARVNGAIAGGASFAQVIFDTVTTGAYTDIKVGQTVFISASNDKRLAYYVGRVRKTATATILYINETSIPIADNDYLFVVDDYRVWDKLAREVSTVQYKDYDVPYRGLLPKVVGLQTAYAGWVDVSSSKLRIAFDISASYACHSGATISSYAWTFPGTATVIAGATNAAAVTIDFAASAGDWCSVVVTDSGGRAMTRHFMVFPHNDTYPPALDFAGAQISGSIDGGWNATVSAFAGVTTVLDNTLAVVWTQEYYAGIEGSIVSTVDFVGRFRQIQAPTKADLSYGQVQEVQFQIEGPAAQLARTEMAKLALRIKATPTVWDEITNLTLWRAIVHILDEQTTVTTLHDLTFDSTANTFLYTELAVQGGDSFGAVKDLAVSINAIFEFAPQGESRVVRDARYLTTAERNALVTVGAFTSADWLEMTISRDPFGAAGRVPASGGYYDTTMTNIVPLLSLAPGMAWDQAPEEVALTRQILGATAAQTTAQAELNTRSGHHFKIQVDRTTLSITFADGYHCLTPSAAAWYTWVVAAADNAYGLAYSTATRWQLETISSAHDNASGARDVNATFRKETVGSPGVTIQYPAEDEIDNYQPPIPPDDPYPDLFPDPPIWNDDNPAPEDVTPGSGKVTRDGNAVIAWDSAASKIVVTRQFLKSANPAWLEITPEVSADAPPASWSQTFDFTLSPYSWAAYHNTDWTPNDWATYGAGSGWQSVDQSGSGGTGENADHRGTQAAIDLSFTASVITRISITYDLTAGTFNQGNSPGLFQGKNGGSVVVAASTNAPDTSGTDKGLEWTGRATLDAVHVNLIASYWTTLIGGVFGSITIKSITIEGENPNPFGDSIATINDVVFDRLANTQRPGAYVLADDGTNSFVFHTTDAYAGLVQWSRGAAYVGQYNVLRLTSVKGTVLIYSPSVSGNALVRKSTDYGQTFGAPVTVGTTPGSVGGYDTQMGGTVSLAAQDAKVRIATTLGGAYADETNGAVAGAEPLTIIISWYKIGSTTLKNTGSTPDYFLASSALVGGEALWKVTSGGGKVAITPSVGGTKALAVGPDGLTCWKGTYLAYLGSISGTVHLFTSTNSGTTFTDRGAVSNATMTLLRRNQSTAKQLYWSHGSQIGYSSNWGASPVQKQTPLSICFGIDVWG
jgi:hypothetical protein